ncbi:unnamed protein product [Chondrus crispus]|uniref:Uncharacterized protein n=1 Tax=Chondrus crispus TaxID=2769 RepID=R7Q5G7_CHOCR|nr:unnamed protein product [Chondrus crispus]CDF32710.1 unnamed protein product [Chondrus crispus]|eukprot:XP_005712481.1 unnamed protein product [Chondrus crispus]
MNSAFLREACPVAHYQLSLPTALLWRPTASLVLNMVRGKASLPRCLQAQGNRQVAAAHVTHSDADAPYAISRRSPLCVTSWLTTSTPTPSTISVRRRGPRPAQLRRLYRGHDACAGQGQASWTTARPGRCRRRLARRAVRQLPGDLLRTLLRYPAQEPHLPRDG